jgi:D-serine deaminase-like pyridoxal phosphate-dependent protein
MKYWYTVENNSDIPTPALLVYPERIEENIRRMLDMAGSPDRLRPHVKTHKMAEIIGISLKYGITRFKCATVGEAEMVAACGGKDVLLAMQLVGPQLERFFSLQRIYPGTNFSTLVDDAAIAGQLSVLAEKYKTETGLWLDINNGMARTGIIAGDGALELYKKICNLPFINPRGLHVYDGHIHDRLVGDRIKTCEKDFEPVNILIGKLKKSGLPVPGIVAGGTPTFPIHACHDERETSPGTCVLWDRGYQENFPDLDFLPAAVLLMRIVSKPEGNLLCLDLGHKAIAAEMPPPRVFLPTLPDCRFISHSEEHMVVETPDAIRWHTGDVLYGIPWHICPTVPRYPSAYVIRQGIVSGEWSITSRDRRITV